MNEDFTEFVASLADAGYSRIHFLCHSMGAMVLFSALDHPAFTQLFKRPGTAHAHGRGLSAAGDSGGDVAIGEGGGGEGGGPRLRMSTAIIINPDSSLERFKQRDYPLLRKVGRPSLSSPATTQPATTSLHVSSFTHFRHLRPPSPTSALLG